MSTSKDIYWSEENHVSSLSYVPGVDVDQRAKQTTKNLKKSSLKNSTAKSPTFPVGTAKLKNPAMHKTANTSASVKSKQVSLRDLCPEDKERVANLIRELAKAGEEKEATENLLNDERRQFAIQVDELKTDKDRIEQEQRSLLSEFKDCQRLLVFYQQKITEEQKEVAKDINRLLAETSINKSQSLNSSRKATPHNVQVAPDDQDITVKEVDGTISSHRSAADSAVSSNQYLDATGALGESFRPTTKKGVEVPARPVASDGMQFVSVGTREQRGGFATRQYCSEPDDGGGEILIRRDINAVTSSASDDEAQGYTDAFERRINALSPNGRREALLKQKRDLEAEQAHLQSLLTEQEEILKYRQAELRRRHVDYTKRMQHFKYHGAFPSALSGADDTTLRRTEETEDILASDYAEESTGVDASNKLSHLVEIDSPRTHTSRNTGPRSEPVLRSRKYVTYSPSLNDDVTDDVSTSLTSSCPAQRSFSPSLARGKQKSYDTSGINDVTNFSSTRKNRSFRKSSMGPNSTTKSSRNRTKSANRRNPSSTSQSELSTSPCSPHRAHHTMNNLSTLSDLVSSVEATHSPVGVERSPPLLSHSTLYSSRSDDTMVSMTFDPEDSQLLEDIFFIK